MRPTPPPRGPSRRAPTPDDARLVQALGLRARARRREAGLTLAALAARCGLSRRFLGELESGRANISVVNLARVARALGTSASALLEERAARTVALLGLRGAGKSTVGAALAARMGVPFVELDVLVEEQAGLPLPEIFAVHGEDHYRLLEARALDSFLVEARPAVIATGGGIVNSPETFDRLRRAAFTVWLRARPEDHMARVVAQGDRRPIAASGRSRAMAQLRRLLAARTPLYAEADVAIDTSGSTPRQVVARIEEALRDGGVAA